MPWDRRESSFQTVSDTTPLRSPYVRVGRTIKRRVRVNRALALWREDEQVVVRVVGLDAEWPEAAHQLITTGMLCEGQRAGRRRFREQRQPMLRQLIAQQRAKQQALHADVTASDTIC